MILRALIIFVCTFSISPALEITASGTVQNQGSLMLVNNARIINGLVAAKPTNQSFMLGAMLLRPSLLAKQTLLKAGLLYELEMVANNSFTYKPPRLAQNLVKFSNKIRGLKPTGRIAAEFNLGILSLKPDKNIPLKNFDHIFIPSRPRGIYVIGAVKKPGLYTIKNKTVVNIVRKAKHQSANVDWAWVIQPDSSIERVGVALWNQQLEKVAALGAIVFIPFADKAFIGTDNFNREMAEFLSTQNISSLANTP